MSNSLKWILIGLLAFCAMIAFIGGITALVMKMMKGDAYELSLTEVRSTPSVVEFIGDPIQPGWFVLGSVSTSGPDGSAALEYSIHGSISDAKVYVYATKYAGEWVLDKLIVAPESSGERIVIIDSEKNS